MVRVELLTKVMLVLNTRNVPGKLLFVQALVQKRVLDQIYQVQCKDLIRLLTEYGSASSRQRNGEPQLDGLIAVDKCTGPWQNLLTWCVDVESSAFDRVPTTI
jgi:hypothetical protein